MSETKNWRAFAGTALSVGAVLLPKIGCPACWPAYAAILSSFGISFVNYTPYILPLTASFLAATLGILAWQGYQRAAYGPLALGIIASSVAVAGKLIFESQNVMFAGIGLLICATIWNSLPRRKRSNGACPACVRHEDQNKTKELKT